MKRHLYLPAIALAAVMATIAPGLASAQVTEKTPEAEKGPSAAEVQKDLDVKFAALEEDAAALAAEYRKNIEHRVDELVEGSRTLQRLKAAGIFSADGWLVGTPKDPLRSLPWLRDKLKRVDGYAQDVERQFGSQARVRNEQVAYKMLGQIKEANEVYRKEDRDGNGILDYAGDLEDLAREGLFEKRAKNGFSANGYIFEVLHGDVMTFSAQAKPDSAESGSMFFYVDQSGVIRSNRGRTATKNSPAHVPK
ncbi:MAG: hypothetical protein ACYTFT_00010 [Planctomycetota bacterium]|jgi:hypothetical protein